MGLKVNIFLQGIEYLLVVYVVLDVYSTISFGVNNIEIPEDSIVGLNTTNEDPKVVGIRKFSVEEYNKLANSNRKFQAVVKALYAQSSYMLLVQVMDGPFSESKQYVAIVKKHGTKMNVVGLEEYKESAV